MLGCPSFRLLILVQYILTQTILSAHHLPIQSLTSSHANIPRHVSPPVILHPFNVTYQAEDAGIRYHVPNTLTSLYFHLGFPCHEEGMRNTVISARSYCEQRLEQKGDIPLPRSEDPFHEDLGYGAAINVVSARPDHRLTWGVLKNAMDGLWEFLVVEDRYVESAFDICNGTWGLMGRGTIIEVPETESARQSRKKQASNPLGSVFD